MANYEGTGRSNYVRVNNEEAFIKVVTHYGLLHKKDTDGKISVISQRKAVRQMILFSSMMKISLMS